ncbi:MAG: four helix bundle protein [Saprospiraceae bacterium]|nr:four helix bundle protein [Candidatus Opimibacter iunctus]
MFDFEKLDVYNHLRALNKEVLKFLYAAPEIDPFLKEQWKTATVNAAINLAEGVGRIVDAEKKQYFTVSRGAIFESVSLMHIVSDLNQISQADFTTFYDQYETVSKMLLGLYRSK